MKSAVKAVKGVGKHLRQHTPSDSANNVVNMESYFEKCLNSYGIDLEDFFQPHRLDPLAQYIQSGHRHGLLRMLLEIDELVLNGNMYAAIVLTADTLDYIIKKAKKTAKTSVSALLNPRVSDLLHNLRNKIRVLYGYQELIHAEGLREHSFNLTQDLDYSKVLTEVEKHWTTLRKLIAPARKDFLSNGYRDYMSRHTASATEAVLADPAFDHTRINQVFGQYLNAARVVLGNGVGTSGHLVTEQQTPWDMLKQRLADHSKGVQVHDMCSYLDIRFPGIAHPGDIYAAFVNDNVQIVVSFMDSNKLSFDRETGSLVPFHPGEELSFKTSTGTSISVTLRSITLPRAKSMDPNCLESFEELVVDIIHTGAVSTLRHSIVLLNYCCWERVCPDPSVFLKFLDRVRTRCRRLNRDLFAMDSAFATARRDLSPVAVVDQAGSSKAGTFILADFFLHRLNVQLQLQRGLNSKMSHRALLERTDLELFEPWLRLQLQRDMLNDPRLLSFCCFMLNYAVHENHFPNMSFEPDDLSVHPGPAFLQLSLTVKHPPLENCRRVAAHLRSNGVLTKDETAFTRLYGPIDSPQKEVEFIDMQARRLEKTLFKDLSPQLIEITSLALIHRVRPGFFRQIRSLLEASISLSDVDTLLPLYLKSLGDGDVAGDEDSDALQSDGRSSTSSSIHKKKAHSDWRDKHRGLVMFFSHLAQEATIQQFITEHAFPMRKLREAKLYEQSRIRSSSRGSTSADVEPSGSSKSSHKRTKKSRRHTATKESVKGFDFALESPSKLTSNSANSHSAEKSSSSPSVNAALALVAVVFLLMFALLKVLFF